MFKIVSFEGMKEKRKTGETVINWAGQVGCLALFIIVFLVLIYVAYSILSTPKY